MMQPETPSDSHLFLFAAAALVFLLAAFGFYLLSDLSAPLPWEQVSQNQTTTPEQFSPQASSTPILDPTQQAETAGVPRTSYTPFSQAGSPLVGTITPPTAVLAPAGTISTPTPPSGAYPPPVATSPAATLPGGYPPPATNTLPAPPPTLTPTLLPTSGATATATPTLAADELAVTGLIIQNGVPLAGVTVKFQDDRPSPIAAVTDSSGRYWFVTRSSGVNFTISFAQADNPQINPTNQIAWMIYLDGYLPIGSPVIQMPNIEISIFLGGSLYEAVTPPDNASISAASITPTNPLRYTWTTYPAAELYYVDLGLVGSIDPVWSSDDTTASTITWDGTLSNGSHVSPGSYWWAVAAGRTVTNYWLVVYTQQQPITFVP